MVTRRTWVWRQRAGLCRAALIKQHVLERKGSMRTEKMEIHSIPAVLYGEPSETVWLFLQGQGGCKEEAGQFAEVAVPAGD